MLRIDSGGITGMKRQPFRMKSKSPHPILRGALRSGNPAGFPVSETVRVVASMRKLVAKSLEKNGMANRICFVELPAASIAPAKSFYADAFGLAMTDFGPTY